VNQNQQQQQHISPVLLSHLAQVSRGQCAVEGRWVNGERSLDDCQLLPSRMSQTTTSDSHPTESSQQTTIYDY